MKILFIIGNGFDINLGIKSKYSDFYNFYQTVNSNSESINNLKKSISGDLKNWSDLELALGDYTENINSTLEFDEMFDDIGDNLAEYLRQEQEKFDFAQVDASSFYRDLCFPEDFLSKADCIKLNTYRDNWAKSRWDINIMTLNYTNIIETILDNNFENVEIGSHHQNIPIKIRGIEHIHGYIDDRMILGVNDITQIKKSDFHSNQEVIEALIKTNCNKAQKHTVDDLCKNQVETASLICIFGSSIGDTDNYWWELIGKQLTRGCQLIIFTKGEEVTRRRLYKNVRLEREVKKQFLIKTKLDDNEKFLVEDNIFVGVNTDLFSKIIKR